MVKLNPYLENQTLDIGSDTMRLATPNTGFAEGLQRFGSGLAHWARDTARAEENLTAKAEANQKMMEGLAEHTEFSRLQGVEAQAFEEAKLGADPSGEGFVDKVINGTDTRMTEYISSAKTPEIQAKRRAQAEALRTSTLKQAVSYETSLLMNGLRSAQESTYKDAGAIIGQQPNADGYALAVDHIKAKAELLQLSPKVREAFLRDGIASLEKNALAGKVAADPQAVVNAGVGVYSGLPTATATGVQKDVVDGAALAGTDAKLLLGIAKIESNFDPSARPIGRDGRPMSSAAGTFQFLKNSAYGQVDPADTKGQALALGLFLNRQKEKLESQGVQATPGTLYMFHNVGEGVANRILASDPSKTMGQVLFEVYGNKTMPDGRLWRDVVARNNPGLYRDNMTVADVRASYERKMAGAMVGMDDVVTGRTGTSEQVARAKMSELLGFEVQHSSLSDLNQAIGLAQKALQADNKKKVDQEMGFAFRTGQQRMSPNDPEQQKLVDKSVRDYSPELYDGVVRGDPKAYAAARSEVEAMSYIPKPILEGARELVHSTGNVAQRVQAFEFMADIYRNNRVAWDAAKIDQETETRVKMYVARENNGEDVRTRIGAIDSYYSPEGEKQRAAIKHELGSSERTKTEMGKLKASDFSSAVAGSFFSPNISGENGASSKNAEALFLETARELYRDYRLQGREPEDAKRMAAEDLKRTYGPTQAFTSSFERARLMQYPPEKWYAQPTAGIKPFEAQVKELVGEELVRRYPKDGLATYVDPTGTTFPSGNDLGKYHADRVDIRVVASAQTAADIKAGNAPGYQIWYRDPKSGAPTLAYAPDGSSYFRPDVLRMKVEDHEAFLKGASNYEQGRVAADLARERAARPTGIPTIGVGPTAEPRPARETKPAPAPVAAPPPIAVPEPKAVMPETKTPQQTMDSGQDPLGTADARRTFFEDLASGLSKRELEGRWGDATRFMNKKQRDAYEEALKRADN